MLFSKLLPFGALAISAETSLLLAIVALACIVGAEIAGICVLISKIVRAKRKHTEERYEGNRYQYGVLPVALTAFSQIGYQAVLLLSGLAILAAIVFLVLLIICRACGYEFASSERRMRRVEEREEPTLPAEEPVEEFQSEDDVDEEQQQEEYTEAEEPFAAFDEPAEEEPFEEEVLEEATEEILEDEVEVLSENEPAEEETAPVPATVERVTTVEEGPAFADGSRPYKVVEKVVTETVKEVYRENPQPEAAAKNNSGLSDSVVEKLVDLLDYELRTRHEAERAAEEKASVKATADEEKRGSVATFAPVDASDEDEDDEDEDEVEVDATDAAGDGEDEVDDEENDTEGDHFTGNERIIGFNEATGCYIVAHYRKSFEAKLIQARPNIKQYYSEIKNALLSYKGTKNRISWTADSFHNGRNPIAKINAKTRILELYLALDPASLEGTVYRGRDVGSKKKYADTPFQYKIRTPRKFKWALELVQRVCEEHGLSPIDIERVNYEEQYPFDTTENLVERKLIKEYIREEKPATSFELAPDHVPTVPAEDESVIPANANFSWEFDNERLEEQEPEPVVEPAPVVEPEPEPEPEPVVEPEPAPQPAGPSIVRETVKVTEMRYTERYYTDEKPSFEQVITTTEPIEVLAEPAEEQEPVADEPVEEEVFAEETFAEDEPVESDEPFGETASVWASLESTSYDEPAEEVEEGEEVVDEDEELFFTDAPDGEDPADEQEETYEEFSYEEDAYAEDSYEDEEAVEEVMAEVEEEPEEEPEEIVEEPVRRAAPATPRPSANPSVALIDICAVEDAFDEGDVISLRTLKARDLVLPTATSLKIYSGGALSKSFTVEANQFTMDAIKAISDADGDVVMIR